MVLHTITQYVVQQQEARENAELIQQRREKLQANKKRFATAYGSLNKMFKINDMSDYAANYAELQANNLFEVPTKSGQKETVSKTLCSYMLQKQDMFIQYCQLKQSDRDKYSKEMSSFLVSEAKKIKSINDPFEFTNKFSAAKKRLIAKKNSIEKRIRIDAKRNLYIAYMKSREFKDNISAEGSKYIDKRVQKDAELKDIPLEYWDRVKKLLYEKTVEEFTKRINKDTVMKNYPLMRAGEDESFSVLDTNFSELFSNSVNQKLNGDIQDLKQESAGIEMEKDPEQPMEVRSVAQAGTEIFIEGTNMPKKNLSIDISSVGRNFTDEIFASVGKAKIDMDNFGLLDEIAGDIRGYLVGLVGKKVAERIDCETIALRLKNNTKFKVEGLASWDGSYTRNKALAQRRGNETARLLSEKYNIPIQNITVDAKVLDPDGKSISSGAENNEAWDKLTSLYNADLEVKSKKPITTKEIKQKLALFDKNRNTRKLTTNELQFFELWVNQKRGAKLSMVPNKKDFTLALHTFDNSNDYETAVASAGAKPSGSPSSALA